MFIFLGSAVIRGYVVGIVIRRRRALLAG